MGMDLAGEELGDESYFIFKYCDVHEQVWSLNYYKDFMLKIILSRQFRSFASLHVEKFNSKDYQTMCSLIREKYPIYNEAIEIHKDVKLLDEGGKLIGIYEPSEARRKALTMKKDIILLNLKSSPAICKTARFRENILKKFIEEIVNKRN